MPSFPQLKTGAVMQYPAQRSLAYSTYVVGFVDGGEQRYRDYRSSLHRWVIRLEQLDEVEMTALEEFFVANQGEVGNFSFTDPWDAAVYPSCSLENEQVALQFQPAGRGKTALVIRENRT